MKFLLYVLIIATAANCGSSSNNHQNSSEGIEISSSTSEEFDDSEVVVGPLDKDLLQQKPHATWFDPMFNSYQPNKKALTIIQEHINDFKIKLYMGTWCADSKREVPKLYKLLELSDYDLDKLEVFGVTRDKTMPNGDHVAYDVHHVPTIIFYKEGVEKGRFVEFPISNFAEDIAKIVSGEKYQHAYDY